MNNSQKKRNLKIASLQYAILFFQSIEEWKNHIYKIIEQMSKEGVQLTVFPEYGSLDLFSITLGKSAFGKSNNELFQSEEKILAGQLEKLQNFLSEFRSFFRQLSIKFNMYILAPSFPMFENGKYVNRAFLYSPQGNEDFQDKIMMTRFENEIWNINQGEKKLKVFQTPIGFFAIQICYDSEFPCFSNLLARHGCEVLLVPSCTEGPAGATRVHISARARSIENQFYTVVSQTIGECTWNPAVDKNYGYASFYSPADFNFPFDGILKAGVPQKQSIEIFELDLNLIHEVRRQGQVLNFRDSQQLMKEENPFFEKLIIEKVLFN